MNQQEAKALLKKYVEGKCSQEEKLLVEALYAKISDQAEDDSTPLELQQIEKEIYIRLPQPVRTRRIQLWSRIAGAAAVAAIIFGAGLFYFGGDNRLAPDKIVYKNDVTPGKQGATLTLASGKKIRLTDAVNGELAKEAGIIVTKTVDGQIVYEIKPSLSSASLPGQERNVMNTLSTAKGETYQVTLPDGTKVWLNAASSLTYAASLVQNGQRSVKLSGEAYLEVAKDKTHPFVVKTDKQEITVLGTHFNVMAYDDEPVMKTTLLEGSVKVISLPFSASGGDAEGQSGRVEDSRSVILKPGQQSVITGFNRIAVKEVNAEDAIDWKSGYFMFNNESLESGLKRIARWYNVQIVYEDASLKGELFFGRISKFEKISKVFNMLERTDVVRFEINGNKIMVHKKK